jgi:hypothetical protein
MEKRWPVESEGLGGVFGGCVRGVTDQSACLVDNFEPTLYELEVLARHYLETIYSIDFNYRFLCMSGSSSIRRRPFADRRLATIEAIIGVARFRNAIASTEEEWAKEFAETEEFERNLEPCKQCGRKRVYYDCAAPDIPDEYCNACMARVTRALGEKRFQMALASTEEEWDKIFAEVDEIEKNLEPCKRCGGRRTFYDNHCLPEGYCSDGCAEAEVEVWSRPFVWGANDD